MYFDARHQSSYINHPSQAKHGIMPFPDKLYVVTPIINTQRYARRYELYRMFEKQIQDAGAILYTAEVAFGGREFEITDRSNPQNIQLRTNHEMWYKENIINVAISKLPPEAKYIAWIDGDIAFSRPDWAQETLQQLQHYDFVQMYSNIIQLSYTSEVLNQGISFMEGWKRGIPFELKSGKASDLSFYRRHDTKTELGMQYPYPPMGLVTKQPNGWMGSPGGAWAARRTALDAVGGLIDFAILGSADYHMAAGLMGFINITLRPGDTTIYKEMLYNWQYLADKYIKHNVGHVYGTILHHWHGKMASRGYGDRWKILVKHQFNPMKDLKKDSQGLWQLTDEKWQLRDDIRSYFNNRNEDEI